MNRKISQLVIIKKKVNDFSFTRDVAFVQNVNSFASVFVFSLFVNFGHNQHLYNIQKILTRVLLTEDVQSRHSLRIFWWHINTVLDQHSESSDEIRVAVMMRTKGNQTVRPVRRIGIDDDTFVDKTLYHIEQLRDVAVIVTANSVQSCPIVPARLVYSDAVTDEKLYNIQQFGSVVVKTNCYQRVPTVLVFKVQVDTVPPQKNFDVRAQVDPLTIKTEEKKRRTAFQVCTIGVHFNVNRQLAETLQIQYAQLLLAAQLNQLLLLLQFRTKTKLAFELNQHQNIY